MTVTNQFNSEAILTGILEWIREESPSTDPTGVNRMQDRVSQAMERMGANLERIPGRDGFGDVLKATFGDPTLPGILVLGHVDTVHEVGTLATTLPIQRDDDRCFGPGILDMKSGLYLAIHALRELFGQGCTTKLPVTFLVIPDEEVGSPTSRPIIEAQCARHRYVLVPEPAREGKVVTGRHAFLRYKVRTQGRPAHAGADNRRGASAIHAMAKTITEIEAHSDPERGLTYSVGVVRGGTFVNVVPIACEIEVLAVAPDEAAIEEVQATLAALPAERDGVRFEVEAGPIRPLFKPTPDTLALFAKAKAIGATLGMTLEHGQFGGGSDGNFTGALGLPTLDGLGPLGAGPHTHQEHILVSSLGPRCRILAGLFETLE